jgi:hypothetical protein
MVAIYLFSPEKTSVNAISGRVYSLSRGFLASNLIPSPEIELSAVRK